MFGSLKKKVTPQQWIVVYYLVALIIGFLLLNLPYVTLEYANVKLIDKLFLAASAISVTGLTPFPIVDHLTIFGQFILLIIFTFGGVGVMSISTIIYLVLKKKIGLKERQLIMTDYNQVKLSGIVGLIREVTLTILLIELLGGIILGLYYLNYYDSWQSALFHGIFSSVSATTNSGFDITGQSLMPFKDDYFVLFVHMLLTIIGAIGFPVLRECRMYITSRKIKLKFSLFTKLTVVTYFSLLLLGGLLLFVLEYHRAFGQENFIGKVVHSLFQSVATRSGGMTTIPMSNFTEASDVLMSVLMFIGASPSSMGGGIRTTTLAIGVLFLINFARGNYKIRIFKREIHHEDLFRVVAVWILSFLLFITSILLILFVEDSRFSMASILFEVASAFGTCGLSQGITGELSVISKIILMFLMFIGRVGLLTFIIMLGGKHEPELYNYPKERVIVA